MMRALLAVLESAAVLGLLAGCVFDARKPEVIYENNMSVDVQVYPVGVEYPSVVLVPRDGGTNALPLRAAVERD